MAGDPHQLELRLREFRLNGFLILRAFLPADLVAQMYLELEPILRAEYLTWQRGESRSARGPARFAFDISRYAEVMRGGALADDRYRRHPEIETLVTAILRPASWVRGWSQVECVWPGSKHMDWHSDQTLDDTRNPDDPNRTSRITYNIPLVDFTWANGSMELLPGSHWQPRSFQSASFNEVANVYPVSLRLQRGDVVLRDGNTLHRGTPNLCEQPRPMLDQTYKVDDGGEPRGVAPATTVPEAGP